MNKRLDVFRKELESSVSMIDNELQELLQNAQSTDDQSQSTMTKSKKAKKGKKLLTEKNMTIKPKLRILHHLACSGGSLVTKCFSALPNTFLLSEVHPHSYRHLPEGVATFLPSDIATLAHQANFPFSKTLAEKIFVSSVKITYEHLLNIGGTLVIRDHSHSDYCVGDSYTQNSTVVSLLASDFEIASLVTVRNPIDCYASLKSNYWLHFSPPTFDEYCLRTLKFLEPFKQKQIVKYEEFTEQPLQTMAQMCQILDVEYDDNFIDLFDQFLVTGDSGRKGQVIETRPRRPIEDDLKEEIKASKNFKRLCKKYQFKSAI